MTDKAWADGMAEFQRVGMPGWPYEDQAISSERAKAYRRHLDSLSDGQWYHAVREAIRNCKWFPTVHELIDFGESYNPGYKQLGPARSNEQVEIDRETARKGVELIREHCAKVGLVLPKSGPNVVEVSEDRKRELISMVEAIK